MRKGTPGSPSRGRSGKHHSKHLFSGFAKCGVCGGAITSVRREGSPRFGCSRSWLNGTSSCPNRLTIRIKVVDPQILTTLQEELLQPANTGLHHQGRRAGSGEGGERDAKDGAVTTKRLEQERRRLQRWAEGRWAGAQREAARRRCGSPGHNPRTPK